MFFLGFVIKIHFVLFHLIIFLFHHQFEKEIENIKDEINKGEIGQKNDENKFIKV